MSEKQEQIALFKRAAYHPIARDYMWASANGGRRNPLEGRSLKMQGVKAGVPDIFLAYPAGAYHGLFIELKRLHPTKGVLSPEQKIVLSNLEKVGFAIHVAYGWEDAWNSVQRYLIGAPRIITCPDCKTTKICKDGFNLKGKQQYNCLDDKCERKSFIVA